jgi:hypothetical protein
MTCKRMHVTRMQTKGRDPKVAPKLHIAKPKNAAVLEGKKGCRREGGKRHREEGVGNEGRRRQREDGMWN